MFFGIKFNFSGFQKYFLALKLKLTNPEFLTSRDFGIWGEKQAGRFLKKKGYKIVDTNIGSNIAEIDIIAKKATELVFVEVKTRKSHLIDAFWAVDGKKQRKIKNLAQQYIHKKKLYHLQPRFDIICVYLQSTNLNVEHFTNSF